VSIRGSFWFGNVIFDLITIGWVFEMAGIVSGGCGTGMEGEAGVVSAGDWGASFGVGDDASRGKSMCGDGEGLHVPVGVSDKEETIFENGTIMEGVSRQIEGWWSRLLYGKLCSSKTIWRDT